MKKAFIVAPRTEGFAREVKNFSSKTKRNILPARGVVSDSTVLVASKLGFGSFQSLRGEVRPDPTIEKEVRRDALGKRVPEPGPLETEYRR